MSDLPYERVTPKEPSFTLGGVDYFEPFVQREKIKVLFARLTVKAVQIEVAHSLDINSLINALRRFIASRG